MTQLAIQVEDFVESDPTLWRYDPLQLARLGETFGNIWHDPVAGVWRQFVHADADTGAGTVVQYTSANPCGPWANRATALDKGGSGAWDEKDVGVPFAWYEAGEARPWRMMYRGIRTSNSLCGIGLATSLDGVTWERKDTAGNALTDCVVAHGGSGQWDSSSMDHHGVIKVGSTYYLYYNTISHPRVVGLATSTNLVTWAKHASNPLFTGVTDFSDATQDGTVDSDCGFFCPDVVRWDDGPTMRYIMLLPHYSVGHVTASIDVYSSASPVFLKANRYYLGKALRSDGTPPTGTVEGIALTNLDTPGFITDDISRNVLTSTKTNNEILCVVSTQAGSDAGWNHALLRHHRQLNGATITGLNADLPVTLPAHGIATAGLDANVKVLWLPGATRTLYEISNGDYHLYGKHSGIDGSGVLLTAANAEFLRYHSPPTRLNAITGDFTLEATVTFATDFTSGYRTIIGYTNGGTLHHFYWYIGGAGGPAYTNYLAISSALGVTQNGSVSLGAVVLNQQYRLAICKTGGKIYFFKDGVLLNAGGSAFNWTIVDTPANSLWIGCNNSKANLWNGYIDELRISDAARWTADYTAAAIPLKYATSGTMYSRVYDFGQSRAWKAKVVGSTPAGTTVTLRGRSASSLTDSSTTWGDYSAIPTWITSRYAQVAVLLETSDTSVTPTIDRIVFRNT